MVRVLSVLLVSTLALSLFAGHLEALEGVGALADRLGGASAYTLTGRTAPWAEVVIVDPDDPGQPDRVYVAAQLEPTGTFEFTFRANPGIYQRLQMFGVDEVGNTARILLPANPSEEILLPPTIVNDTSDTSSDKAALTGFSFPGSTITLTLTNLNTNIVSVFTLTADSSTGRYRYLSENLAAGRYVGVAISEFGSLVSENSQEIFFEIPLIALPPIVGQILELIPGGEAIRRFIEERADLLSRLALPVAFLTSGLLLTDLIAFLLKLLLGFLHLLGFRRNRRSWGVVYDAKTKQPLERCIVRLYDEDTKSLVETDVTGSDGVFSFLPREGKYRIKVTRSGFVFPSSLIRGSGSDGEYEYLYHGEVLEIGPDQTIAVSIPMDPVKVVSTGAFRFRQFWRQFGTAANWIILFLGTSLALYIWWRIPDWLNTLVLVIYILLIIWSVVVWRRRAVGYGKVLDRASNQPVFGIGVSLYDLEFNRLVQRRVSDESGRFQLVVPQGTYRLDIISTDWVLDVGVSGGFRGELLTAKGKKTTVLKPTLYVVRRSR